MFRVYKPKNVVRVKAVQVTKDNIQALADLLMGRVSIGDDPGMPASFLQIPTFDGIKTAEVGQWVLRNEANELIIMDNVDFEKAYDVARNTAVA